jgi:predicted CDP-diglyceride synthetase/phosphatidate cytidylyltransferase
MTPEPSFLPYVPLILACLICVIGLALKGQDFLEASGVLAWAVLLGALLLTSTSILPTQSRYDQQHATLFISVQFPRPGELPSTQEHTP